MKETICFVFAVVGGAVGWFLGGFDGFLYGLVAFVVADYITGVMCAIAEKKLSSEVGAKGIVKKVVIFMMVGLAHMVDTQFIGGDGGVIRTAVIFFYAANEGISLIENAGRLGLPVPQRLKDVLEQLKKGSVK